MNLFWLFWILRIAYRFVFMDELNDDRCDDDEVEFAEEQRLDALVNQGSDVAAVQSTQLKDKISLEISEIAAGVNRKEL